MHHLYASMICIMDTCICVKDEVKQARRAKRVAEGHQLEIGAQRAPRFLVYDISIVENQ